MDEITKKLVKTVKTITEQAWGNTPNNPWANMPGGVSPWSVGSPPPAPPPPAPPPAAPRPVATPAPSPRPVAPTPSAPTIGSEWSPIHSNAPGAPKGSGQGYQFDVINPGIKSLGGDPNSVMNRITAAHPGSPGTKRFTVPGGRGTLEVEYGTDDAGRNAALRWRLIPAESTPGRGAMGAAVAGAALGAVAQAGADIAGVYTTPDPQTRMQGEKTYNTDVGLAFNLTPEGELEADPAGMKAARERQARGQGFPTMYPPSNNK